MPHHHLHASPATCHWRLFEAQLKPVLTIASGDEVTIDTISGGPEVVPDRGRVPAWGRNFPRSMPTTSAWCPAIS